MNRRKINSLVLAFLFVCGFSPGKVEAGKYVNPVDYVNPLMGTQSSFELSTGNTYPAIALPWGDEFLDSTDRTNGRWLGICIYCT